MKKCVYLMLTLMTIYSCKKECIERQPKFLLLKPEVKSSMPYQGGQIVNFERAGEIYSFVVSFELDTVKGIWGFCEDCCTDTVFQYEEQLRVELYDSKHNMRFAFISLGLYQSMFLEVYPSTIQHPNGSSSLTYSVDTLGDFACDLNSVSLNGTICHDTITLGSTLYSNVAEMKHYHGWYHDVRQVFYSQEKGILKVTFHNSSIDELVLIE